MGEGNIYRAPVSAFLASLVPATIGGLISAFVAWRVLKATSRNQLVRDEQARRQEAAESLIATLADLRTTALDQAGNNLDGSEAAAARALFRREVNVRAPALAGCELDGRLGALLDLLAYNERVASLGTLSGSEEASVLIRLGRDRHAYIIWILECLQDVAVGSRTARPDTRPPAAPHVVSAAPWIAPPLAPVAGAVARRRLSRRRSGEG